MRIWFMACLCGIALPAHARVTELVILREAPFAEGASFGAAGPYVRIDALARGTLDPADPANAGIALLDQAPRNAQGLVEYDTDVSILQPADPARGSGVLLYDVTNRGNKYVPSWINDAREPPGGMVNSPATAADAGQAYTFRRGMTLAWSGWQPEVRGGALMSIRVPVVPGMTARIRNEFQVGTRSPEGAYRIALPYPIANTDTARLTVRDREAEAPQDVDRDSWGFVDSSTIQGLPFGTPFQPRRIYELSYVAIRPTVNGIGFAATRDVVAHLRQRPGIRHTLGFGVSLSGRFLRHFIDLGMNRDEDGRRVFDGVLAHIGGAGKVFANEPFAMPGRTATQHEDRTYPENWPPYDAAGLLRRPETDPKLIESNTSTEYWQKGASLIHEGPQPDTARAYLVPGTQHGGHAGTAGTAGFCANPRNPNSAGPALRAMLANLEAWVVSGTAPPASVVPRAADGTGVPAGAIRMPAVPGLTWAPRDNPVGPPTLVPAVDADGNEVAGIRLPHVAVPLGTSTGISVYKDMPGELCDRDGIYAPFARTRAERERTGDPRPSLEERYGTRDAYVARVRTAVDGLVGARLLLAEDADRYVDAASAAW